MARTREELRAAAKGLKLRGYAKKGLGVADLRGLVELAETAPPRFRDAEFVMEWANWRLVPAVPAGAPDLGPAFEPTTQGKEDEDPLAQIDQALTAAAEVGVRPDEALLLRGSRLRAERDGRSSEERARQKVQEAQKKRELRKKQAMGRRRRRKLRKKGAG